jgi:uncharacterized protein with von Willebrand factor type A (vWA) domain
MEHRHRYYVSATRLLLRRVCYILLILLCQPSTASSSTTQLDLSYLHRTQSSTLANAIRARLSEQQKSDEDIIVDIDISASMIGKDIQDLTSSLETDGMPSSRKVYLTARGNQWRPDDASKLFQAIVGPEKPIKEKEEANKEQKEKSVTGSTEQEASTEKNSEHNPNDKLETAKEVETLFACIECLDLAWNDFSQEHLGSKAFLKALQNTIQDSRKCPKVLRLDVCGLGPAACRAIGKVRDYGNRGLRFWQSETHTHTSLTATVLLFSILCVFVGNHY